MGTVAVVLLISICLALVVGLNGYETQKETRRTDRSFRIDTVNNRFLKDGKPFQYVSGSFHYFRALPETWKRKLRTMRAAGLNAVDTYVEWALHNPEPGVYKFDEMADILKFIQYAAEEDLLVILRPGPYICAERDNGGLPYWLFTKYPDIKPRTSDENYKHEVKLWLSKLLPLLHTSFYENNGPIIMIQVENEYGAFPACDKEYTKWLAKEINSYVKDKALLFTTDIPDEKIQCGKIDGVFATTDFGIDRDHEMDKIWSILRGIQPNGPLVNSEFYPGWLTHWQEDNQRRDSELVAATLRKMLKQGASVNFYMFYGGTNFGFTAGANDWGVGKYLPDITSYDYDAVMDEAGDPTLKFQKIREVIGEFLPLPNISVPERSKKMSLPTVNLKPIDMVLSDTGRQYLISNNKIADRPATFEELQQFSGLMLYEAELPDFKIDPSLLTIEDLRDRATVLVDGIFLGVLSRENAIKSLPISAGFGKKLQIIVENQGRINFHVADDIKGILGKVTIQQRDAKMEEIKSWTSSSIPLDFSEIKKLVSARKGATVNINAHGVLLQGPAIFHASFDIPKDEIYDTYIDPTGWGKGVVYINGFNLGRYWPLVGPQITVYVPKELLKKGTNEIILVEYQKAPYNGRVIFSDKPKLDGQS